MLVLVLLINLLSWTPAAAARQDPWTSARAAARLQLQGRPDLSPTALRDALITPDAGLIVQVIRLDARSLLVALQRPDNGEVFIVSHRAGRARIAWSAVLDAAQGRAAHDPLNAWRLHATGDANDAARGRLAGTVIALPSGPGGERRFAINAVQTQEIGAAAAAQLSLWRWTGRTATPLLVTTYTHLLSEQPSIALAGGALRLREKGDFKTFIPCGACAERRLLRTLALTNQGAEDRGAVDLDPDLALVDAILDNVLRGQPDPRIETQVLQRLKPRLPQIQAQSSSGPALGALNGWTLRGGAAARTLCLATDQTGAMTFTLRGRGDAVRVTAVRLTEDVGCDAA